MKELAMCRVCLAEDVRLRLIANTHLQEMNESLTLLPLETKDSRPIQACYICCAGLQNCYQLRKRCLRSEELLTQILSSDVLQPINVQEGCTQRLKVDHPVIHLSIGDVVQNDTDDDTTEDSAYRTEATDVVDHEREDSEVLTDIKMEPQEEHDAQIGDNIQCSHLEDPLDVMKREPDVFETDTADIKLEIEDISFKENVPNGAGPSSVSANNTCPKIVKVVLERMVLNDSIPATGVPAFKKLAETDSYLVTESENVNIVVDKLIALSKIQKIDATLHKLRDNKVTAHYEVHKQTSKSNTRICAIKKCFRSKAHLDNHSCAQTNEKRFQCEVCKKCFSKNSVLTRHMFTHTSNKPYMCGICKKRFSRKIQLTDHLSTHTGEKRFQCDICNKCFASKCNLNQHLYTHASEKRFQCDMCKKCFKLKSNLTRHLYTHIGETGNRFQCDVCKKCLSSKQDLTRHMCSHTGKSKKSKLTRQLTHTLEKRFQCDICNKWFTTRSQLKIHTYIHTGEKRFQCDICNKCFSTKCSLKDHIHRHYELKLNTTNIHPLVRLIYAIRYLVDNHIFLVNEI